MKNNLDQFYTNPKVANDLVNIVKKNIKNFKNKTFIEPSAGMASFVKALMKLKIEPKKIYAYDIDPKHIGINKVDYLKKNIRYSKNHVIIGNPPFGKRAKLAIDFVNKGLKEAPYVAMILPRQFNRYLTQKQIDKKAKLIYSENTPKDIFIFKDKKYNVNCVFQIWSTDKNKNNLRILSPEHRTHDDFETRIYNNTKTTLKYFDKKNFNWDYAFHRQGFYDYNEKITNPKKLIKKRQYFFIKVKNKIAHDIIKQINFDSLSKTNTQTPGYSTTDFVRQYIINKILYVWERSK